MILELSSLLFIINKPWNCFPFLLVLLCWSQLTETTAEIDGAWWQMANCSGDRMQVAGGRSPGGQVAMCLLDPVLQCGSPVSPPHLLSCLHVCVTLLLPIYYIYYKLIFPNISDTITIFWEELSVILYYVTYSTTLLTRLILHLWFSLHQTSIKVFLVHYFDDLTFVSFTVVEDCVTCFVEI